MKLRVAVVYGGRSGEHDVSVRSARSILDALDPAKYETLEYFIDRSGKWKPEAIRPEPGAHPGIDVVFPVLHGTFGEDGTVQGLFELADLPYVGAGVLGSAVSMDKEMMKRVCAERLLPVVDYVTVTRQKPDVAEACRRLPFPMFIKPANLGSSVGISKAHNRAELEAAVALAAQYDRKVIVERAIVGRELECAVLGNEEPVASLPCEILPSRDFYDYDDKYLPWNVTARWSAKAWGASIFCSKPPPENCISTRSIPSQASRRSACFLRCGSTAAWAFPRCLTG